MGFQILNFNIFWVYHSNEYFGGYKEIVYIFFFFFFFFWGGGGSLQNWDYFWGHFYTLMFFFLRSRYILEISFGVAIISDILGGMPDIPDISFG